MPNKRARAQRVMVGVALVSFVLFGDPTARATVTQVDGRIVPIGASLQNFFNTNDAGMNAIADAGEQPQIFLPRSAAGEKVVFTDLIEDAGFENSIGWYNVGDDVFSDTGRAANLHPVLGCGVPMATGAPTETRHQGNPAFYVQNAEPTPADRSVAQVEFAQERTAGRYKGGFIGLYLISPQRAGGDTACGDFRNISAGTPLFGKIYYSQKAFNSDGDYVHHLVYTSRKNASLFYFGFEDSFRNNDNDFNDMFISVDGLKPPCAPTAEICDGKDNDCDGNIDDSPVDADAVCTCDGSTMTCQGGNKLGPCQTGKTVCTTGALQCQSTVPPVPETCNNVDDNCNGPVDDNPSGTGGTCGNSAGDCDPGHQICVGGVLQCSGATTGTPELCDGRDNDCNGIIDDNVIDDATSCGSSTGVCRPGATVCVSGDLQCQGATGGGQEVCNNLDDDCDGKIDGLDPDLQIPATPCGSSVGSCRPGHLECSGGQLECVGATGPAIETCNGFDDDCDGHVDNNPVGVGQSCRSQSTGVCELGTLECVAGTPTCVGEKLGSPELCNDKDDDCNGIVDDNPSDVGAECTTHPAVCKPGHFVCSEGQKLCLGEDLGGTETCNGVDDDCDGKVDEGPLCANSVCDDGACAPACAHSETPCKPGQICENDVCLRDVCFGVNCPPGTDGVFQVCEIQVGTDGKRVPVCAPRCEQVTCSGTTKCRPSDGRCVPNNCDYFPLCTDQQLCVASQCVANPCAGVTCADGQFCRAGTCVGTCAGVDCGANEVCRDGTCTRTGCSKTCTGGQVCNPSTGQCGTDPCIGVRCARGNVCDPNTGQCAADACTGVKCPGAQECHLGNCFNPSAGGVDAGPKDYVTPGGGGCDGGGGGAGLIIPMIAGLLLLLRRRAVAALALATVAFVSQAGCQVNEFCVNCQVGDDGGAGDKDAIDSGGGDKIDADPGPGCDGGVENEEVCNGLDDNCDGLIDDGFDLKKDPRNCGSCGHSCFKAGTETACDNGTCVINSCAPNHYDKDTDNGKPFDESNGCEYTCYSSRGGDEACDSLDNDCDGKVDEATNLQNDAKNCGVCGRVCAATGASSSCNAGSCAFACLPDHYDIDGRADNGCEYACEKHGAEVCDVQDNDCDGEVDNGVNTDTDPNNCGRCNNRCVFPHVQFPQCGGGLCGFRPIDCAAGFFDVDQRAINGCEYQCTATARGPEICDGQDNDCNGIIDDFPTDAGGSCSSRFPAGPRGACAANGTVVCAVGHLQCQGATQATAETCDGADNDCDSFTDEGDAVTHTKLTRECYGGPAGTSRVGECRPGAEVCTNGRFDGICVGQVLPLPASGELCDNRDQDCDGRVDESTAGTGPLTQACYTGSTNTQNVGVCHGGNRTCGSGAFGACVGQVVDIPTDTCGDTLDTDCDGNGDAAEGCMSASGTDVRADNGSAHSFDLMLATGGTTSASRLYAVWTDLTNTTADVFFAVSSNGGTTWTAPQNLTGGFATAAVEPYIVVAPGKGTGNADLIYIVYQVFIDGGTEDDLRDIRVARSKDGGATFDAANTVNGGNRLDDAGDSFHQHATVSADGQTLAVVWERLETTSSSTTLPRSIHSRVSTDGAVTFNNDLLIDVRSPGSAERASQPQVAIAVDGAGAKRYVWAWREALDTGANDNGATNDVFTAFTDNPATQPTTAHCVQVDSDNTDIRDVETPRLLAAGARVYLVWQDIDRTGGGSDIVLVRSTNRGDTWSAERTLDESGTGPDVSASFAPSVAILAGGATTDRVGVAWEDHRSGSQIFTAFSADSGATFTAATRGSSLLGGPVGGESSAPALTFAAGPRAIVAYVNTRSGKSHVYANSTIDNGVTWAFSDSQMDSGTVQALQPVVSPVVGNGLTSGAAVGWIDFRNSATLGDVFVRRIGQ